MTQYCWADCPDPYKLQVNTFLEQLPKVLGDDLVGVYLHGSLALKCFNPIRSDINLLVVSSRPLASSQKRHLGSLLVHLSRNPASLEVHFLCRAALKPWQYPTCFDYYYRDQFRTQIENLLLEGGTIWEKDANPEPELAIHIATLHKQGIVLLGPPVEKAFATVPEGDLLDALFQQVLTEAYSDPATPRPTELILNSSRVYAYLRTYQLYSKDEAGVWALTGLPAQFRSLIQAALKCYRQAADDRDFNKAGLEGLLAFFQADFKRYAALPI